MSYVVGGCSTYSKVEFTHLPHYPKQVLDGDGSRVWTREKEYIDFTCSLGAISLGYEGYKRLPRVPLLPLPTPIEEQAAEYLCYVTGHEQVRWCKNGSDATEAAVRVARLVTGRALVACNSYHGSHDSLVSATEGKRGGLLQESYNTLRAFGTTDELIEHITREVAAVIVEPRTWDQPWDVVRIRERCDETGTILIFDEMITGWRARPGSIEPVVKPDLSCYGKAIANGEAVACVAGSRSLMKEFEKRVFMSGTAAAGNQALYVCFDALSLLTSSHFDRIRQLNVAVVNAMDGIGRGYPGRHHITLPKEQHELFVDGLAERGYLVGRDFFFMEAHTRKQVQGLCGAIEEVRNELGI